MAYSNSPGDILGDYAKLRTVPALLSILFAVASLFQFGGMVAPTFDWFSYTLTQTHAVYVSMVAFLVAFMSSETKSFDHYEKWEQFFIAAGPILILTHQYVPEVTNFVTNNSPVAGMIAFALTIASWGVAIR